MKKEGIWIFEDNDEFIKVLKELQKEYFEADEK